MSIKGKSRGLITLYAFLFSATVATFAIGSSKYNPGGGGGGAVSTVSGSSGVLCSPTSGSVVCSASAVPLASLASQADQTFVCNRSGGSSAPSACTAAQATAVIAPATESLQGALSAADKIKVDALGWYYTTAVPQMKVACPSCTGFKYIPAGNIPGGVSMVSPFLDAVQVGGGVGTASDSVWGIWTVQNYTQPKTVAWVIAYRGKLPTPTSGKTAVFGLVNAGRTHYLGVSANFTVSSSKFTLGVLGASDASVASTVNSDTAVHTFVIGSDTTTGVKLYVDGNLAQTQASYTQVNDENMQLGTFSSASLTPGVVVDEAAIGF